MHKVTRALVVAREGKKYHAMMSRDALTQIEGVMKDEN
jgi:hypothetical protein